MNGIDSNVAVRWLVSMPGDEASATRIRETLAQSDEPIHLNPVVLAETSWVLRSTYRLDRAQLVAALRALVSNTRVVLGDAEAVTAAIDAFEQGGAGFTDHLIGSLNAHAGCKTTLTFDKRAARSPHFTVLEV